MPPSLKFFVENGMLPMTLENLNTVACVSRECQTAEHVGRRTALALLLADPERRQKEWMSAVRSQSPKLLRELIAVAGPTLLALEDRAGRSCLCIAAESGNMPTIRYLVGEGGVELLLHPSSCLRAAAAAGHAAVVCWLLRVATANGTECLHRLLMLQDRAGSSCICAAAAAGRVDVMRQLLSAAKLSGVLGELLMLHAKRDGSCLCAAANAGHVDVMRELLRSAKQSGVLDQLLMLKTEEGYTCLYLAVMSCQLEVVNELLALNSRFLLNAHNRWGGSCIAAAASDGDLRIVQALLRAAERSGDLEEMVAATNDIGLSVLYSAIRYEHLPVMQEFLRVGGETLLMHQEGYSLRGCLHLAAETQRAGPEIVKILTHYAGAHARDLLLQTDRHGGTCLHSAVENDNMPVLDALLYAARECGVESALLCQQDNNGRSCLHLAVLHHLPHAVRALLAAARDATCITELLVLRQNSGGNTCLHLAASLQGESPKIHDIVLALVDAGGLELLCMRNDDGDSCLHIAAKGAKDNQWSLYKELLAIGGIALYIIQNKDQRKAVSYLFETPNSRWIQPV